MKNKVMWVVIGWVLVAGVVWTVSAYSTNIWSPIQYVKQLFITPNGEFNSTKASIKLNWATGRIDAKSIYVNWQEVATKWNAWMFKKNGTNAYYNGWNVWIWTTDPQWKLDVRNLSTVNSWVVGSFEWNNKDASHLIIQNENSKWRAILQVRGKDNTYNWDAPRLDIGVSNVTKKALIYWNVKSISFVTWNVWIWTTNPKAKLDVNGNVRTERIQIGGANNWSWLNDTINWYDNWMDGSDGALFVPLHQKWTENSDLRLYITDNSNDKFSIWWNTCWGWNCGDLNKASNVATFVANWNVWIWTTDPKAKLDVNGDIRANWVYKTSCPSWMYKYWNVCIDATHSAITANRDTAVVNCSNAGKQLCSIADVTVAMHGWLHNFTNEWLLDFSKDDYYAYINIPNHWENPEGVDGPNRSKYKYYRCCVHLNP